MANDNQSKIVSVRLSADMVNLIDQRADERGLTRSDWLNNVIKRTVTDSVKMSDTTMERIESKATEKGLTRAEYISSLIKADLDAAEVPSWARPYGSSKRKRNRHRKKPHPDFVEQIHQTIMKGFEPLQKQILEAQGQPDQAIAEGLTRIIAQGVIEGLSTVIDWAVAHPDPAQDGIPAAAVPATAAPAEATDLPIVQGIIAQQ